MATRRSRVKISAWTPVLMGMETGVSLSGSFHCRVKPHLEVNDFRSVDYEAISMLNVSVSRELARQIEAKDARIAALEKSLAALHAKDEARDLQPAAIEALLTRDAGKATTTVARSCL